MRTPLVWSSATSRSTPRSARSIARLEKVLAEAKDGYGLHELSQLSTVLMATIVENGLRASVSLGRRPRETHELSRSGEPWHRIERLQHIVGWMDQWLQGKKNVSYATP